MTAELIEIDSSVLRGNVLNVRDFDPEADFDLFEQSYITEYDPIYVSCKVPMESLKGAHALENSGFRVIEFQNRCAIAFPKPYDVSAFPFDFERVTREEDLAAVLEIAGTTFTHDRFYLDPCLDAGLSGTRYREYVRQSFHSPNEAVYRLVSRKTGLTVAFKTHRYFSSTEVLFLLQGVRPDLKNKGVGVINEYFETNELIRKGYQKGITHISGANYAIVNFVASLGYRFVSSFAVLRKIYH
jgi:hypothetical protein